LRTNSGFARDEVLAWCEVNGVHFVFGLAKNDRLIAMIKDELAAAEKASRRTGKAARRFKQVQWTTRKSSSRKRRVVAEAKWTQGEHFDGHHASQPGAVLFDGLRAAVRLASHWPWRKPTLLRQPAASFASSS
jgi:hypothetical protein